MIGVSTGGGEGVQDAGHSVDGMRPTAVTKPAEWAVNALNTRGRLLSGALIGGGAPTARRVVPAVPKGRIPLLKPEVFGIWIM